MARLFVGRLPVALVVALAVGSHHESHQELWRDS